MVTGTVVAGRTRIFDARPDSLDFRDRMYEPTLVEVPPRIELETYKRWQVPVLNQGSEGACTGFGLATLANYLLRRRAVLPDPTPVSSRMLYEMARRYDEWPGENYSGASARGAMKGWHKHGVCSGELWPYEPGRTDGSLTAARVADAARRPLGAYYRVNHKDLVAMHSALAEVGILYASAIVHRGWDTVGPDGIIPLTDERLGGHAFVIVAYDDRGFWIQNSWGIGWGAAGFALITYDDWLTYGQDVWVARLGVPVALHTPDAVAVSQSAAARQTQTYAYSDLRPHIISIGNDGRLRSSGTYGTSQADVQAIFREDFPRITSNWSKKRVLLYAHGGLVDEASAIQKVAEYRRVLLENEVYPVSFVWKTDFWTTLTNMLQDAVQRRRPEGYLDAALDFMLDRLDDALEPVAAYLVGGRAQWEEMKENALLASAPGGGARAVIDELDRILDEDPTVELHVVGHSAGSIFHAPLVQLLTTAGTIPSGPLAGQAGHGHRLASCTLWAPACTTKLFKQTYLPVLQQGGIAHLTLFTLTDQVEQDDHCANIYHKSLLYLVSNAFEDLQHIPLTQEGEPLLGMETFIRADGQLDSLFRSDTAEWVLSPNTEPAGSRRRSTARHHGDFDDDQATLQASLARILDVAEAKGDFQFSHSASSMRDRRLRLGAQRSMASF